MLAQLGLRWTKPPLRAVAGGLKRRYERYTDTDRSAADSALFAPSGVWFAPFAPIIFGFFAVLFTMCTTLRTGFYLCN